MPPTASAPTLSIDLGPKLARLLARVSEAGRPGPGGNVARPATPPAAPNPVARTASMGSSSPIGRPDSSWSVMFPASPAAEPVSAGFLVARPTPSPTAVPTVPLTNALPTAERASLISPEQVYCSRPMIAPLTAPPASGIKTARGIPSPVVSASRYWPGSIRIDPSARERSSRVKAPVAKKSSRSF